MTQATEWRKSSYSSPEGGNCVEVADLTNAVAVRDSKNRTGPVLEFTAEAWSTFIDFAHRQDV